MLLSLHGHCKGGALLQWFTAPEPEAALLAGYITAPHVYDCQVSWNRMCIGISSLSYAMVLRGDAVVITANGLYYHVLNIPGKSKIYASNSHLLLFAWHL